CFRVEGEKLIEDFLIEESVKGCEAKKRRAELYGSTEKARDNGLYKRDIIIDAVDFLVLYDIIRNPPISWMSKESSKKHPAPLLEIERLIVLGMGAWNRLRH